MYDDYYGPGSEEYDQDMYEEFQQEYQEFKQEYEQEKWEQKQKEQMYEDERDLQESIRDTAQENCYADYSGGKKPSLECDYSNFSTTSPSPQETAMIGGVVIVAIIAIAIFMSIKHKKDKR